MVQRCRNAYESGKTKSLSFRRKQLKQLLKMYEEHESDFVAALATDLRKVRQILPYYDLATRLTSRVVSNQ
jgi:hypothetical protein